jgi:hypothetical protein
LLVAALVIPAQVSMLPLFLMLRSLKLVNTYAGAVLPGLAGIIGIFLIRQFAQSIPEDLIDAARLEGAGEFRIYRTIVLPFAAAGPRDAGNRDVPGDVERLRLAARRPDRRVPLHAAGGSGDPRRRARAGHRADDGRRGS